jgi:hypothetical protein
MNRSLGLRTEPPDRVFQCPFLKSMSMPSNGNSCTRRSGATLFGTPTLY